MRRRDFASSAAEASLAASLPGDREADRRGDHVRSTELEAVDDRHVAGYKRGVLAVSADREVIHRDLHQPEQPRGLNAAIVIVNLRTRTGLEQIHSDVTEDAPSPCPVSRAVLTSVGTHVGLEVVPDTVAAH